MRPDLILPNRNNTAGTEQLSGKNNFVIIGSNGAGKTRLGSWIEFNQGNTDVHRISAQRALSIPDSAPLQTLEIAENWLFYGWANTQGGKGHKRSERWHQQVNTGLLSDYEQLLSTLFARSNKRDFEHTKETREKGIYIQVPDSPIEQIIAAWKDIMPQNEIAFDDGKVLVNRGGNNQYHGKEMSDGERVTLYLLGQCLVAPENSIIIIDEPEIHLHKSLMNRLWNTIEELCPEKVIVYITHDLDFAAARKGVTKIWIKNFDGTNWTWDIIPEIDDIPENLTLEILGSRKNILFCEGDKGSYDYVLYQAVYPDYHVLPRGSCEKVIESTKATNGTAELNHLTAIGIIDSDYRSDEEIKALAAHKIYTVSVAEIENLFCIEPILRILAENQHLDPDTIVSEARDFIIAELRKEIELQASNHAEKEINFRLNSYTKTSNDEGGLHAGLNNLLKSIDLHEIYLDSLKLFENAINENNLEKALKIYNRKKLAERISPILHLAKGEYINIVFRMINGSKKTQIVSALKKFLPNF